MKIGQSKIWGSILTLYINFDYICASSNCFLTCTLFHRHCREGRHLQDDLLQCGLWWQPIAPLFHTLYKHIVFHRFDPFPSSISLSHQVLSRSHQIENLKQLAFFLCSTLSPQNNSDFTWVLSRTKPKKISNNSKSVNLAEMLWGFWERWCTNQELRA